MLYAVEGKSGLGFVGSINLGSFGLLDGTVVLDKFPATHTFSKPIL